MRLFTLLLILIPGLLFGQEGWYSIDRTVEGNNLNSIHFIDSARGYIISEEGNLLMTTDGGTSWETRELSPGLSLHDIEFVNDKGIIAADSGKIFITKNGTDWYESTTNTVHSLRGIDILNSDTVYVFGDFSTILKSTDGGSKWTNLNLNSSLNLVDGEFPTADFGVAVSGEGILLKTYDYGKTWNYLQYYASPGVSFYSVEFSSDSLGFVSGWEFDVGMLLRIKKNSNEFDAVYPEMLTEINSIEFLNADEGFVAGGGGIISHTSDGGDSWERVRTINKKRLNSIYFPDTSTGYACGDDSTIMKTTDGGDNWSLIGSGPVSQLMAVDFINSKLGFTVGTDGEVFKIENDSLELLHHEKSVYNSFHFVEFLNDTVGFTGGSNGKFFITDDGGYTWELKDFRPEGVIGMWSIDFYENRIGIVSANNKLLKTTNAGKDWTVINSKNAAMDAAFIDSTHIVSVGLDGKVFKSNNGGFSWTEKPSGATRTLHKVCFINENEGFAVGWSGNGIKTNDGGESWKSMNINTTKILYDIKFVDEKHGYIAGEDGIILYTNDGGNTWTKQKSHTNNWLNEIAFVDESTGYVVGNGGTIIKTINAGVSKVEKIGRSSGSFTLYDNYPNPFNPTTTIRFELPQAGNAKLVIYDALGREIRTLIEKFLHKGTYEKRFEAGSLSSGVYFYNLTLDDYSKTKKFVLIR